MTIVFRADASTGMGTGHVMRCVTLAETLQARGARTSFVCRDHQGNLIDTLRNKALHASVLPAPHIQSRLAEEDYAAWLGVPQSTDAEQTIETLQGNKPDWLVVDHYALDAEWEQRLRPHIDRLLVIDDLANRDHDCDVLLDQNYSTEGEHRHLGVVPKGCQVLSGPRYALLAQEYASYRQTLPAREGPVHRVLVYFGGTDPHNMTGLALEALSAPEFRHLDVDVVIGTNSAHRATLGEQAARRPHTHVHGTRPHLADLMARADLAIGAGGVTTWERMCLGLPSLVVSIANNQRPTCEALSAEGLIQYVGDVRSVGKAQIRAALKTLLQDRERRAALSCRGQFLVDGRGASRVADVMLGPSGDDLIRTRNALHEADACPEGFDTFTFAWIDRCRVDDVLVLRNMPHVTAQMRSRDTITNVDHRTFLDEYHQLDRYDFILIDHSRDRQVGGFYITNVGSSPQIGKYIGDPDYLGKGIAYKAMRSILDYCRAKAGLRHLVSMTRSDNVRNIALNARLGFRHSGTMPGDYVVMKMEL